MPRFPLWIALLVVVAGCHQRLYNESSRPWRITGVIPVDAGDSPGENRNAPLRFSFNPIMGEMRGHRWSEDERLIAVWSAHTFTVFDVASERKLLTRGIENHEFIDNVELQGRWIVVVSQCVSERSGVVLPVLASASFSDAEPLRHY